MAGLWWAVPLLAGRNRTINPRGWTFYNLAAAHNKGLGDQALHYAAPELAVVNASSKVSDPVMTKV